MNATLADPQAASVALAANYPAPQPSFSSSCLNETKIKPKPKQKTKIQTQTPQQHPQRLNSVSSTTTTTPADSLASSIITGNNNQRQLNLSFAGCGFLGIYHVGVASCFKEYAPHISTTKICGSSAGALVAVAHVCGNEQLGFATTDILKVAMDARRRALGPFHPSFDLNGTVAEALDRGLPDDAHIVASGKLHISLTRVSDGANVIINEFATRDELITALLCSCFIPLFSGIVPPKLRGVSFVDGGFSNNLLVLDDKTITVSPFCGEADICPQDETFHPLLQMSLAGTPVTLSPSNLYRLSHALLPPAPEVLKDICQQGFDDGMRYLQRNKLISCNRCMLIRSPPNVNVNVNEILELETIESRRARYKSTAKVSPNDQLAATTSTNTDINNKQHDFIKTSASHNYHAHEYNSDCDSDDSICYIMSSSSSSSSTTSSNNSFDEYDSYYLDDLDDGCDDCKRRRQSALLETLPELCIDRFREACDQVNKSLYNWLCSHRPIKYLSYMATPYLLPMDITLSLSLKAWNSMPGLMQEFVNYLNILIDFLLDLVLKLESNETNEAKTKTTSKQQLLWTTTTKQNSNLYNKQTKIAQEYCDKLTHINDNDDDDLLKKDKSVKFTDDEALKCFDNDADIESEKQKQKQKPQVHPFYKLVDNAKWQLQGRRKLSTSLCPKVEEADIMINTQKNSKENVPTMELLFV